MEQINHKRDEKNQQKHEKQETLIRKSKRNHFYVVKQCKKHRSKNVKNNVLEYMTLNKRGGEFFIRDL